MAIQVWDGTKYVGAELGRFGPSGTLKEALVWDGTKYVKVWPTGPPRYAASSNSGAGELSNYGTWALVSSHTVASEGNTTGTWAVTWVRRFSTYRLRVLHNGVQVAFFDGYADSDGVQLVTVPELVVTAGDLLEFQAYAGAAGSRSYNGWVWELS